MSVSFEYRTLEKVTAAPARAVGIVNVILVPNSPNFANDIQTVVGQIENPVGGGFTPDVADFRITLNPNDTFVVDVDLTAIAESTDPLQPAACSAEVVARIRHILLAPVP